MTNLNIRNSIDLYPEGNLFVANLAAQDYRRSIKEAPLSLTFYDVLNLIAANLAAQNYRRSILEVLLSITLYYVLNLVSPVHLRDHNRSCLILSYFVLCYLIVSYVILSYLILSYIYLPPFLKSPVHALYLKMRL